MVGGESLGRLWWVWLIVERCDKGQLKVQYHECSTRLLYVAFTFITRFDFTVCDDTFPNILSVTQFLV